MDVIWSVDRITQGIAVCEGPGRTMREISLDDLPPGVREGDCLRESGGFFVPDEAETARRRAHNAALLAKLRQNRNKP